MSDFKKDDTVYLVDDEGLCASDNPPPLGKPLKVEYVVGDGTGLSIEGYGDNAQGCHTWFRACRFSKFPIGTVQQMTDMNSEDAQLVVQLAEQVKELASITLSLRDRIASLEEKLEERMP